MNMTTLSSPTFSDTSETLFAKWNGIEGNESKTRADFFTFLASRTLIRDLFLHENASVEYSRLKAGTVLSNLIPF